MKRKLTAVVSIILCVCLFVGASVSSFAAIDGTSIMDILSGKGGKINVTEWFVDAIRGEANKESAIDKWVENVKKAVHGEDPRPGTTEEAVRITVKDGKNVAELLNTTVNELKKFTPGFTYEHTETLPQSAIKKLENNYVYIQALLSAFTNDEDIAANMIKSATGQDMKSSVKTKYTLGNNVKKNISVKGKSYVAQADAEDVRDCTLDFYTKNRFTLKVDFKDFTSDKLSSAANVVDLPNTKNNKYMKFAGTLMRFKYTAVSAQVEVDKDYNVKNYSWTYTIQPEFKWSDGKYSTMVPMLMIDMANVKYIVSEKYSSINYTSRMLGDATGDGKVNAADARAVLRISAGLAKCGDALRPYIDVDSNGMVNSADARIILRVGANLQKMPTSKTIPSTPGTYARPQSEKDKMNDLRMLIVAYQTARNEEEMKEVEDAFKDTSTKETTTKKPAETTTHIKGTTDYIDDTVGIIGDIIGGLFG